MIEPPTPENETERQAALERYAILDSLPEQSFDDITALMAEVCDAPISLIGLIDNDRHWLKSHHGIDLQESPRNISFCGHTIASRDELFVVEDARLDARFSDNPLVSGHGAIGYAGAPLIDADGFALGALCVFSNTPLVLKDSQKAALISMGRQVMYLLERHLKERRLEAITRTLEDQNHQLTSFAGAVTHDLLAPVLHIAHLTTIIEEDGAKALKGETLDYLAKLRGSSTTLQTYVEGLLGHYTSADMANKPLESFSVQTLFDSLRALANPGEEAMLVFSDSQSIIYTHFAALQQVLLNLLSNAIKFGAHPTLRVDILFEEDLDHYRFSVTDNGPGIPPEQHESIFSLFDRGDNDGTRTIQGAGIGLATVRKILDQLNGTVTLTSAVGSGSTFHVTLPRNV